MASKDSFVFSQPNLVTCSFYIFYDMKKKGELSDVSVRINNRVFAAHRVILAAAIPYFRTMFTSSLAESTQKEVTMKELDPAALECLIDFAYTSKVKITAENVQSLLIASEYLQLTQVRDSCCDFLSKRFDPSNVMKVRLLADSLNCLSLVKNADTYIRKHFEAFSQTKDFLSLSFSFLNDLIRKDDLQVSSEERIFDAVTRWVKKETERHKMLPDLLTGVRMTFLTPQFLIKNASQEKLIMDSVACRDLLDEAKHYLLLPEEGATGCSFTLKERCYGPEAECGIYLFCCNKPNGLTIFKYITSTGKWNSVLLNDKSRSDVQHVLALGDEVYVFRKNIFEAFNLRTLTWKLRATFPSTHPAFKHAIPCKNMIYWFGNTYDGHETMYFDNQRNQWVNDTSQNLRIYSGDELVPFGNAVYIFGSTNRFNSTYRWNGKYSLQTHGFCELQAMEDQRSSFGSAVLGDSLYVCGGISCPYIDSYGYYRRPSDTEPVLRSTEVYSSSRGWRTVSSMIKPRKDFSLVAYKGQLYAIGGTTGTTDLVEVHDPSADKWTVVGGSLDGQYDFVKAVAISGEKN